MKEDDRLKELEDVYFTRYFPYIDIREFIQQETSNKLNPKIIEFGGSNGRIKSMFNCKDYEVAPNYPKVNVEDLSSYQDSSYDYVVLDNVLEHVKDPITAIKNIHQILRKDGWFILTLPFLMPIHAQPDYRRWTKQGLKEELSVFSRVEIKSWGNSEAAQFYINRFSNVAKLGFARYKEVKQLGINLENDNIFPLQIYAMAQK